MILSQTAVKDLEREESCPYKWMEQWVNKNPLLKLSSEHLDKGKYFEYLVIGAGAINGEEVKDLPRLANGNKSVDQVRIEQQAEKVRSALYNKSDPDFLGFEIKATQLFISCGEDVGTADIEAVDEDGHRWIIDLKLTKDLSSDRTEYGWGNDWEDIDLMQLAHYQDLYTKSHNGLIPKMGLIVADYSPKRQIEFGEIIISDTKLQDKKTRFDKARNVISLYEKNGWIKYPSYKECKGCPLECDKRISEPKINKRSVNY